MSNPDLCWFKSSHSSNDGDNCVEVATCPEAVHVRDSKVQAGPELAVAPGAWTHFLSGVAFRRA
ncbi:DUF397 domain-containing protein [Streptomyces sp. NPDC058613]|uniref:DUF397 domain-containing protein n=1 Tax=unclassified Streptomyces TaxID=2593676 RepID=UPI00365622BF